MRIISLVPSITELLYDLGLEENLVGITKFCVRPTHLLRQISHIGGTKTLNIDAIRMLQPDLIIANKEENVKEQVEALEALCPVLLTDVPDYASALSMIKTIGEATSRIEAAKNIIAQIQKACSAHEQTKHQTSVRPRAAYLIWQNPYMSIGRDTFAHSMLSMAGFTNVFADRLRYPKLTESEIRDARPDAIFLSSEPFRFRQKHLPIYRQISPEAQVILVDGEAFTWYGSRMIKSFSYFSALIAQIGHTGITHHKS